MEKNLKEKQQKKEEAEMTKKLADICRTTQKDAKKILDAGVTKFKETAGMN